MYVFSTVVIRLTAMLYPCIAVCMIQGVVLVQHRSEKNYRFMCL